MDDKELLQLAANAAGIDAMWRPNVCEGGEWLAVPVDDGWLEWNPLTDDGDALRLAVKLGIVFFPHVTDPKGDDKFAATRRAIVCAAAEIGTTHG